MYKLIAENKRNSILLFSIIFVILIVMGYILGTYIFDEPVIGVAIGFGFAVISGLISYYSGDSIILTISRAKEIKKEDDPQLWNVVEELTIASGLPMPRVFIIEDMSPNAFATGRDPKHASVAITRGLMQKLNREELQGVMAHELSHVQNYDILFATMIAVLVGTIVMLADFFLRMLFYTGGRRRKSSSSGNSNYILFIIALVFAIIAPIFAQIIQFAVSRQREYLADASAAKMTRNPIGLAKALEKISSDPDPLEVANRGTQHLYIVNPLKKVKKRSGLFDTHPVVGDRVMKLKSLHYGGISENL